MLAQNWKRSTQEIIDIISRVPIFFSAGAEDYGRDTDENPTSPIYINVDGPFYANTWFGIGLDPDNPVVYEAGSFEAQMTILIHELAHKVMPNGFTPDNWGTPYDASQQNTDQVIKHCAEEFKYLKFLYNKK